VLQKQVPGMSIYITDALGWSDVSGELIRDAEDGGGAATRKYMDYNLVDVLTCEQDAANRLVIKTTNRRLAGLTSLSGLAVTILAQNLYKI